MIIKMTKWGQATNDGIVLVNTDHIVIVYPLLPDPLEGPGSQIILSNGERFVTPVTLSCVFKLLGGEDV